ncbi:MAG TPA: AAA family ATPase, partial [Candidatus Limnocylindrales bacterium]|nr:AAA family ATPase [Candidatus Limnocylindrales bacterium]
MPSHEQHAITDDLEALLEALPPVIADRLRRLPPERDLIEVIIDLGRPPEARFGGGGEEVLLDREASEADIAYVIDHIGSFGDDNRAGIERTLHRISAIRNRSGKVVGLTCRIGRAVFGTIEIIEDLVESGRSILIMGRPGIGKTTMLREAARVLADDMDKRVVVVDTSNEIAGDGDIPHPGIGRARRMQVPRPSEQHGVMIEAVENHMPEVIVIDEIGTTAETQAARTIAERGVQLIATAHGNTLENLLQNPTLSDLVGGIQAVTLSDEEARRRGTQKTVLERKAPPTFDVLIEIQDKDRLAVHHEVAEVVDRLLRDIPPRPEIRVRTDGGGVEIHEPGQSSMPPAVPARAAAPRKRRAKDARDVPNPWEAREARTAREAAREVREPFPVQHARPPKGKAVRVFPYAVSKSKLERAIRKFRLPLLIMDDLDEAEMVITLKAQERRQPRRLKDAMEKGVPLHIIKSNTLAQMESFVRSHFG